LYQKISENYYRLGDYKASIDYKSKSYLIEKQFIVKDHYLRIAILEAKLTAQINERDNKEKELLGSVYRERTLKKEYFYLALLFLFLAVVIAMYSYFYIRSLKQRSLRNAKVNQHKINRQQEYLKNIKEQFDEVNKTISRYFTITTQNVWEPVNSLEKLLIHLNEKSDEPEKNVFTDTIGESLVMSYNLLENLLYWSRHQLDKVEYEPGEYSVDELINNVCKIQAIRAYSKDVELRFGLMEGATGYFDYKQIEIAVRNLIENAIKFSTNGSVVLISIKSDENRIVICIEDSGVGFTKEQLSRIFAAKKSYTAIGTHGEKGGGIGLALTKLFIEKNFGSFFIESSIAKGTAVTVNLPANLSAINIDSRI
jgi:signal transduction histidine kinase